MCLTRDDTNLHRSPIQRDEEMHLGWDTHQ